MTFDNNTAAVLGGGAGARAAAAELALAGWSVRLWGLPEFLEEVEDLLADPHLQVDGLSEGRVELETVTDDIVDACRGASLILIVAQSAGHRPMAEELARAVTPEHVIVVMPGGSGGALEVRRIIAEESDVSELPVIGETATLPFAARSHGRRGVTIRHRRGHAPSRRCCAPSFPASARRRVCSRRASATGTRSSTRRSCC